MRHELRQSLVSEKSQAAPAFLKFLFVAALIIVALCPSLFFTFGFHNDFNAWTYETSSCCWSHPETAILMAIGRYFGALAQNIQFMTIHTLADLWMWRLIGIISVGALATYYLKIVSLGHSPTWRDTFLTVAIFTLPTMQFQAIWVSMYMFWTPPILLALLAAHLLLKADNRSGDRAAVGQTAGLALLAFAAILAGLCFYQMSATFVLVPMAHLLATEREQRFRLAAMAAAVLLGIAFVTYFAVHKFLVLPLLDDVPYLGVYEFQLASGVVFEAVRRALIYLDIGRHLWLGIVIPWFALVVGAIAAVAALFCLVRLAIGKLNVVDLMNFALICCLFLVAITPIAIVGQFSFTYRITFTLTAIVLIALYWLLSRAGVPVIALAAALAATGFGAAFADVYGTAEFAGAEYQLVHGTLGGLDPREFHRIVELRPVNRPTFHGLAIDKDFGGLRPSEGIFDQIAGTRFNGKAKFDVGFMRLGDPATPLVLEKDATVVDLSPIYGLPRIRSYSKFAIVSATPRGTSGPLNAVSGEPGAFWEVCDEPFPIELELEFSEPRAIASYRLSTEEEPERMPQSWTVSIRSEGLWHVISDIRDEPSWNANEHREYAIEPKSDVSAVKLTIHATEENDCLRLYEFRLL